MILKGTVTKMQALYNLNHSELEVSETKTIQNLGDRLPSMSCDVLLSTIQREGRTAFLKLAQWLLSTSYLLWAGESK